MTRAVPNAITAPLRIVGIAFRDPASKQRDFQRKLRVAIVPQTEADFPSVVVDREIARVRNEIENPMREDCEADDQRHRLTVVAVMSAADRLINECCDYRPNHGRDQTV